MDFTEVLMQRMDNMMTQQHDFWFRKHNYLLLMLRIQSSFACAVWTVGVVSGLGLRLQSHRLSGHLQGTLPELPLPAPLCLPREQEGSVQL